MRALMISMACGLAVVAGQTSGPRFERVHSLRADEHLFAYGRATPDGRYLAYTSQLDGERRPVPFGRVITIVDLESHQIQHTELGLDAYWSNDGRNMIYSSIADSAPTVQIRHHPDGQRFLQVAPYELGDYYSWAVVDGRNLIVTILGNYYYLDDYKAVLPHKRVPACPGIGMGSRPLVSHDGRRITVFVRGTVVVRNLADCDDIMDTGIEGGKADFSWDGRYIAMHVLKGDRTGYEVQVVDLQRHTVRTVTNLRGSSLFPSWLNDGRILFNYDGEDYRGFVIAVNFMSAPERPLLARETIPKRTAWSDIFPGTSQPKARITLVMVWSAWSAHSADALTSMQDLANYFGERSTDVQVLTAIEPATRIDDAIAMRSSHRITLPAIPLGANAFLLTDAKNQIPATLLFREGVLVNTRLGAQTFEALRKWLVDAEN